MRPCVCSVAVTGTAAEVPAARAYRDGMPRTAWLVGVTAWLLALEVMVRRQGAFAVELRCEGTEGLEAGVAAAAHAIASEMVINAARHSGAAGCRLCVHLRQGWVTVQCDDEGVGIPPGVSPGVGLRSMRERAEELGGSLEIAALGPGTRSRATIAVPPGGERAPTQREEQPVTDELIDMVLVEDHPVFRIAMAALLDSLAGIRVVAQAASATEARQVLRTTDPESVVIMDLDLGDGSGVDVIRELLASRPHLRVLVMTMHEDDDAVVASIRAGARGFLVKSASAAEVDRAVRAVANGEMILAAGVAERAMGYVLGGRTAVRVPFPQLTDREREVLDLVAGGHDNLVIARRLALSPKTVRNHVANVLTKLGLPDRSAAIVRARGEGLGGP